jgi:5,10-methylene-tetrahydrofolate dehydrogenase/methenyl tetrahydrofolate cyclohydrolase
MPTASPPLTASRDDLLALNANTAVDGSVIQPPLPAGINAARVLDAIDARKDQHRGQTHRRAAA